MQKIPKKKAGLALGREDGFRELEFVRVLFSNKRKWTETV